ncbi:MAG: hypothetical protein AAFZ15_08420 [Bacteroidota bacterium]
MKTSALFAVCMAVATLLSAGSFSGVDLVKCRNYANDWGKGFTKIKMIEQDLIEGRWTTRQTTEEKTFFFTEKGQLQILIKDGEGYFHFDAKTWKVAEIAGQPVLVLKEKNGLTKNAFINQNCEGITLTDIVSDQTLSLEYHSIKAPGTCNKVKNHLIGYWTNVSAMESVNHNKIQQGAFVNYFFSDDGTYALEYGSTQQNIEVRGTWKVSKDGRFLLLEKKDGSYQVVRIGQVDDHGMVLEQVMKSSEINQFFQASNKTFAFIK